MKNFRNRNNWIVASVFILTSMLSASIASAEAMRPIVNEEGFYKGPNNDWKVTYFGIFENQVSLTEVKDPSAPEGAGYFHIAPKTPTFFFGIVYINDAETAAQPRDFSAYSNNQVTGYLRFWMRNPAPVFFRCEFQDANGNKLNTAGANIGANPNWRELIVVLNGALANGSIDNYHRVTVPISFVGISNDTPFDIDDVRWVKPSDDLQLYPNTNVKVNPGKHRQFTVESTSGGELVVLGATFTATRGSMDPAAPFQAYSSIYTAGPAGNVTVTATKRKETSLIGNSMAESVNVLVTNENLDATYGVVSETIPGAVLGGDTQQNPNVQNSTFTAFRGNAALPQISDVSGLEGSVAVQTTVQLNGQGTFAGWNVATGKVAGSAEIIDMSNYYDGSLRFWFKAPQSLENYLTVGVRSINVSPDTAISKVLLKDYGVKFDDQWHPVALPIKDFARSRPFADLSRIKDLFTISVASFSGTATFYVDNVRWDTRMPGALNKIIITPSPVTVPSNSRRIFRAVGLDVEGTEVDIAPDWNPKGISAIGELIPNGNTALLKAVNTSGSVSGTISATANGITGTANVTVATITFNQIFNVYSDLGVAGPIGVATGPAEATQTFMLLDEVKSGSIEGTRFMHSTYTLDNFNNNDSYAVWFVEEGAPSRFMRSFNVGYLRFFVRTDRDLQFSVRSLKQVPGNEGKIRLSQLGIPLDNNWQEVIVALSDFGGGLNFDEIKNYFTIGGISSQIGEVTNETFDVDGVQWLTTAPGIDDEKIYLGLKEKQNQTTWLVQSYNGEPVAYTYDQAIAAMAYIYRSPAYTGDINLAKNLFNTYQTNFYNQGSFAGFANSYNSATRAIMDGGRTAGPNAFMLLALTHYRNVTNDNSFDTMADSIANWLLSLQDADGAIKFGNAPPTPVTTKSTEHNFDVLSAFRAYAKTRSAAVAAPFLTASDRINNWLLTRMFDQANQRFYAGENLGVKDTRKALDVYSLAPLSFSTAPVSVSYSAVLRNAEIDLSTTVASVLTGLNITGFDFGGNEVDDGNVNTPSDTVWYEGTAQMVLAFKVLGDTIKADTYTDALKRGVVDLAPLGAVVPQGLPYAAKKGTSFGNFFTMDASSAAVSSMAWYLFSQDGFNPMSPYPITFLGARNTNNHQLTQDISWPPTEPGVGWVMANQYAQITAQGITKQAWGIQIYTDNTNPSNTTRFVDPTLSISSNTDSQPAGLLAVQPVGGIVMSSSSFRLPLAWSIKDSTKTIGLSGLAGINAAEPNESATNPDAPQWLYMKDIKSPDIDANGSGVMGDTNANGGDSKGFTNGEPFVRIRQSNLLNNVATNYIHGTQEDTGFFQSRAFTDYVYFQANFDSALPQVIYSTNIYFEFFNE